MERRVDGGATNECDDGDDACVNDEAVDAWMFRASGESAARGVSRAFGFLCLVALRFFGGSARIFLK